MTELKTIELPELGDFDEIEIIEILVAVGDQIQAEDSIIVLESDKATMEIPSPYAGQIKALMVVVGERISAGTAIATVEVVVEADTETKPATSVQPEETGADLPIAEKADAIVEKAVVSSPAAPRQLTEPTAQIHTSPSIRRYARELGVDLQRVTGSGAKGRILKQDVTTFVKHTLSSGNAAMSGGITIPAMTAVDFSKFGETEVLELNRIQKISGSHLHRSWVSVPHVTQFDEADITDLEAFRKSLAADAAQRGVRVTLLVFIMKAVVSALKAFPQFNASLAVGGEQLILKKYYHIGVAVDTPNGLVVPVIRDVDQKTIFDLAQELGKAAERARAGKLVPDDMQGGCFSISSLGGIGGTQFTPIVNAPEVAIVGVAKASLQPVYDDDGDFHPRLILPLALSYDHRVIDGAEAARFTHSLGTSMADIRRLLL